LHELKLLFQFQNNLSVFLNSCKLLNEGRTLTQWGFKPIIAQFFGHLFPPFSLFLSLVNNLRD
jgi:hypothetical protein